MEWLPYQLKEFISVKSNLVLLTLLPETADRLNYQAGQYLEILYPGGRLAPFSIANAPPSNHQLELHLRVSHADHGITALLSQLTETKRLMIRGPFGTAFYRPQPALPVIILAGGTGFAYAKSIIEAAMNQQDCRTFHLFWNVKTSHDFYLTDIIDTWLQTFPHFKYTPVVSQTAATAWSGKTGYAHHLVLAEYPDLSQFQVYASGPFDMVQTAWHLFQQHGLQRDHIYSDML